MSDMTQMQAIELEKELYEELNQHNMYPEELYVDYTSDVPKIVIFIMNGDWKHDHLRTKWIVEEYMKKKKDISIISHSEAPLDEVCDSDCGSSEHHWYLRIGGENIEK